MTNLLPHVIYPFGPLLDLIDRRPRQYVVYCVEFTDGVVKLGRSRDPAGRMRVIAKDGAVMGLSPLRFFVSPHYSNAGRVEQIALTALRDEGALLEAPTDLAARTEWITGVSIERALGLVAEWQPVEDRHGAMVALRVSDMAAKAAAEQLSVVEAAAS